MHDFSTRGSEDHANIVSLLLIIRKLFLGRHCSSRAGGNVVAVGLIEIAPLARMIIDPRSVVRPTGSTTCHSKNAMN